MELSVCVSNIIGEIGSAAGTSIAFDSRTTLILYPWMVVVGCGGTAETVDFPTHFHLSTYV